MEQQLQAKCVVYLHGSGELGLVLHLLAGSATLHTAQDGALEEEPPVLMENLEQQLKHLCLHIWAGALQNQKHTQFHFNEMYRVQNA